MGTANQKSSNAAIIHEPKSNNTATSKNAKQKAYARHTPHKGFSKVLTGMHHGCFDGEYQLITFQCVHDGARCQWHFGPLYGNAI
mmetsp:Transcript_31316/g.46010  ORF Transcript_31316/g.46010 Transcript_31316/m.46010 type:complete len:85 (+) Transcript_31316:983-1237(+)